MTSTVEIKEKYAHLLPERETFSRGSPAKKYHLATYGCQMNVYDSNLIAEMLEKRGFSETSEPEGADVVIVNTCSIRGGAEDRAYARIAAMRHYKKLNPNLKIAVIGCMAQNHGEKIPVSLKHVDVVAGPDNYRELEKKLFQNTLAQKSVLVDQDEFENYPGLMAKLTSKTSAFVTIMRGCNKRCTYCIVPFVRGKERSRAPQEIEAEVRRAVEQGIPEVILLGQTVNSYRHREENFAGLLGRINRVPGLRRIRFTSPHPRHFTGEVIQAMAECETVCSHVHLPVQSGSDTVLKSMRRQYTRERFLQIVEELRDAIPGIAITTDIIVGYPGESKSDFQDTLSLVRELRFDSAFTFSYSPREGTVAYGESDTVTDAEKSARLNELIEVQNDITRQKTGDLVGQTKEILLEGPSFRNPEEWVGKTDCFKKVVVPRSPVFNESRFVTVRIVERRGFTLAGTVPLSEESR